MIVDSEKELDKAAKKIIECSGGKTIWLFYGNMGSGKTTLIRAISEQFNIEDNVSSPTFSIVNEYRNLNEEVFYHFDFYRIKNEAEAMDIGIEEYFDSGDICFVEWPENIPSLLPNDYLKINIEITSPSSRNILTSHHGR